MKKLPSLLSIVSCVICLSWIFSAESLRAAEDSSPEENVIVAGVPEGFDDLLEEQLALVDVFYQGRLITSVMARYTPDSLSFESPQELVNSLSNITNPSLLINQLSLPQNTNQSKLCFYPEQANCGVLTPEIAAIIFDESNMRVELFVNPVLVGQSALKVDKYLPPSTSGTSMINSFSLVAAGGDEREEIYTAQLSTVIGFDNYRIVSNIESDDENGGRLDQLSFVYEYQDLAYQVGTFRSLTQPGGFYQQRDFVGFRINTSLASRTDLEQVSGSRIFVFLNERSQVEVYKDGQLIDSQIYQAGNIELDTREFPQGAYNVELRITGDSGRERTESHFYSKSFLLPPKDETVYFAELGFPEADQTKSYPVASDDQVLRLGFLNRPSDYFGFSGSLVANPEQESIEFGSYWLGNQVELQTNHSINSEKEHANYYLLSLRHQSFFMSASYRRTYTDGLALLNEQNRLIDQNQRQTTFNFGIPLSDAVLNIFARTSEQQDFTGLGGDEYRAIGLNWRKNILRSGNLIVDWTIDATKENDDQRIGIGFVARFIKTRWNLGSSLIHQSRKRNSIETDHLDKNVRLAYRDLQSAFGRANHSIDLSDTQEQQSATVQSEVSNDYGYGRIVLDHVRAGGELDGQSNTSRNSYSITSRFNLVSGGGEVTLGGDKRNSAGVMLDLTSIQVEGLSFAVIINGSERTRVKAGETTFVALSPYATYRLTLSPKGGSLVDFDNSPKDFTLYPGNVESFKWDIEQVRVVVMQLIDSSDQAFANARLKHDYIYATTDDLGWVQMEIAKPGMYLFENRSGQQCAVKIDPSQFVEMVNFIGTVNCAKDNERQ